MRLNLYASDVCSIRMVIERMIEGYLPEMLHLAGPECCLHIWPVSTSTLH